jgi:hypothetical protein
VEGASGGRICRPHVLFAPFIAGKPPFIRHYSVQSHCFNHSAHSLLIVLFYFISNKHPNTERGKQMTLPVTLLDIKSQFDRHPAGTVSGAGPRGGLCQTTTEDFGNLLKERLLPTMKRPARGLTAPDYLASPLMRPLRACGETDGGFRNKGESEPQTLPAEVRAEPRNSNHASRPSGPPCKDFTETPRAVEAAEAQIEKNIIEAAEKYDLPPDLIRSVIRAESNFDPLAVSRAGARGLMQLMPATAEELGIRDSFDIGQNIDGGSRYLRNMLNRFNGNVKLALSAYNAGPGTVERFGGDVPYRETRLYVQKVMENSRISV